MQANNFYEAVLRDKAYCTVGKVLLDLFVEIVIHSFAFENYLTVLGQKLYSTDEKKTHKHTKTAC